MWNEKTIVTIFIIIITHFKIATSRSMFPIGSYRTTNSLVNQATRPVEIVRRSDIASDASSGDQLSPMRVYRRGRITVSLKKLGKLLEFAQTESHLSQTLFKSTKKEA